MVSRLEMDLDPGSDIRSVLRKLEISGQGEALLMALNGRMAAPEDLLTDGDVLRLMPAMSGGAGGGTATKN
jgi:molybdopterin converting factor small subunit